MAFHWWIDVGICPVESRGWFLLKRKLHAVTANPWLCLHFMAQLTDYVCAPCVMDARFCMGCSPPNHRAFLGFHGAHLIPQHQGFAKSFIGFPRNSGDLKPIISSLQTNPFQPFNSSFMMSGALLDSAAKTRKRFSMSYVGLVATAILRSPYHQLSLSEIYQDIDARFPEFTASRVGWKNTVRHNLSLHDCFVKGELAANGKSCYWRIHPAYIERFSRGDYRKRPTKEIELYEQYYRDEFTSSAFPEIAKPSRRPGATL